MMNRVCLNFSHKSGETEAYFLHSILQSYNVYAKALATRVLHSSVVPW